MVRGTQCCENQDQRDPLPQAHRAQTLLPEDEAQDTSPEHLLSHPSFLGQGLMAHPCQGQLCFQS